MFYLLLISRD